MSKTCKKCGFFSPDLDWDRERQKREGIWKLAIITKDPEGNLTTIPHVCKEGTMNERPLAQYKSNIVFLKCQSCDLSIGWFTNETDLIEHKRIYHKD